jgi:AraC-like DNA-binding protein
MERQFVRGEEDGDCAALATLAEKCGYRAANFAQALGVSLRQLERIWKREFATSPQAWLDDVRMNQAEILLANGVSIKETLFRLGYKQVSHFSRQFKKRNGMTPGNFARARAMHKGSIALRHLAHVASKQANVAHR